MVIPIGAKDFVEPMVQLYPGLGNGAFALWPVDGHSAAADFEDVNQDGVDDGIIAASGAAPRRFPGIAAFNGGGLPDVVVSGNGGSWPVDTLVPALTGEFSDADSDRAGQKPQFFVFGDFNEDGYPDVAVGAVYNGVLAFLDNADGSGTIHQEGGAYLSATAAVSLSGPRTATG